MCIYTIKKSLYLIGFHNDDCYIEIQSFFLSQPLLLLFLHTVVFLVGFLLIGAVELNIFLFIENFEDIL